MLRFKNILVVIITLTCGVSLGQKGTQSPYSAFGLGELNYEGYAVYSAMGGVALGNTDSTIVNSNNPASYSYISRNYPVLQLGMNGKLSRFSTTENSTNQRHFGLNQFQLGIPISKNWGAGIGIKPYSFKGYTVTKYTISGEDTTMQSVNEGSGGIRIANFGLAYRPLNMTKPHTIYKNIPSKDTTDREDGKKPIKGIRVNKLSLGASGNYLFGTSEEIRSKEFIPSSGSIFNARVVDGIRVSGLTWQLGLNYQLGFQSSSLTRVLSVGMTYSPATEVRAFQDLYSFSYVGSFYRGEPVVVLDTIQFIEDNQGSILRPEAYGIGFEYRLSPYNSPSLLRIGVDLKMEKWSTYYTRFSDLENPGGLKDRLSVGIGLDWTPQASTSALEKDSPFARMHYRLGFNYTQTELLVQNNLGNSTQIDNYGMSFGLGLPILPGLSNTNLNFGASLGNLGTTENGLINERYMGIYVGLSISPLKSSRWFVKRKYN